MTTKSSIFMSMVYERRRKDFSIYGVLLIALIPIALWFLSPKVNPPFTGWKNILASFGELSGIIGMVLFSTNLILTTRLKLLEKWFNGLNRVYEKHSKIGQLAIILLLFHPLFLIQRYAPTLNEAAHFLFLGPVWAKNFGILALWLMIILIVLTLYLRPRYDIWKKTHQFFGLALFLGGLHTYLIPSYVMHNPLLKGYVLLFAGLGILSFAYKTLLGTFLMRRKKYVVEKILPLNDEIVEIQLISLRKKIRFKAGQFMFISFRQKGLEESHPFSFSSAPNEEIVTITVKSLGDYTKRLQENLHVGTLAEIEGPYGVFSYERGKQKQIWIAGGIGITPFISFIKDMKQKNRGEYDVTLFYSVREKDDAVYLDFLKEMEKELPNFSLVLFVSSQNGYLNADYMKEKSEFFYESDFYLCAPPAMIHTLKEQLRRHGISEENLYSEEFNL